MRRTTTALPLIAAVAFLCLILLTTAGAPAILGAGAPGQSAQGHMPCDPTASRQVEPLLVPANGKVGVRVEFDYACPEDRRQIDFVLVVELTDRIEPQGWQGRALIGNIRDGLESFVVQMDYDNGTRGGMVVYNSNDTVRVELEGENGGRQHLLSAINNLGGTANRSARAAGEAVDKAVEMLTEPDAPLAADMLAPTDEPTETMKVIVLLDAGAPITNADVDVLEACQAAKDAGVHMSVFALESAGDRFMECANENLFRGSAREGGQDIPDRLGMLGDGLAWADQVEQLLLSDRLGREFDYVEGSGSPEEPVGFMNELSWDIDPPAPPGGHVYEYEVKAGESHAGEIVDLSRDAIVTMFYRDGSYGDLELDNPRICIYPPGMPEFCDDFVATLTPPAPTDTPEPTATITPTPDAPVETPTAIPTEPPVVEGGIYLPLTIRGADLREGG